MPTYKVALVPPPIPWGRFDPTLGFPGVGINQPGGFSVAEYASWANLSLTDAQTVLNAAVAAGTLVVT